MYPEWHPPARVDRCHLQSGPVCTLTCVGYFIHSPIQCIELSWAKDTEVTGAVPALRASVLPEPVCMSLQSPMPALYFHVDSPEHTEGLTNTNTHLHGHRELGACTHVHTHGEEVCPEPMWCLRVPSGSLSLHPLALSPGLDTGRLLLSLPTGRGAADPAGSAFPGP